MGPKVKLEMYKFGLGLSQCKSSSMSIGFCFLFCRVEGGRSNIIDPTLGNKERKVSSSNYRLAYFDYCQKIKSFCKDFMYTML